MKCTHCNKEISDNKKFCNRSCSTSFNNKNRIVKDETKNKISKTLRERKEKHKKYQLIIDSYNDNINIDGICKMHSVTRRTVVKILKEQNLYNYSPNNENSICEIHQIKYELSGKSNVYRCKKCMSERVKNDKRILKIKAVDYKGGKCSKCSYDRCLSALEFHHLDPKEKDFTISHYNATSQWEKIKKELDKCILVCSNCHREIHEELKF